MAPKKVVVLGGGISALATVFELTNTPNWQDNYDITVYTMGWRLGGKVASSRNPDKLGRLEDTGVHFIPGFYENFFKVVRACYTELTGDSSAWLKAFDQYNILSTMEANPKGGWYEPPWIQVSQPNDKLPGDGSPLLQLWQYFLVVVDRVVDQHFKFLSQAQSALDSVDDDDESLLEKLREKMIDVIEGVASEPIRAAARELRELGQELLEDTGKLLIDILEVISKAVGVLIGLINELLQGIAKMLGPIIERNTELRRSWIMLQLGITIVRGVLFDEVLIKGFRPLDKYDFIEWLERNGAEKDVAQSCQVLGIYEGLFAFEQGNLNTPNLAAGVALYTAMRWFLTYKGALIWRPIESTGVAIFSPLYTVLKNRGVKFEFFHRVHSINMPDTTTGSPRNVIDNIVIGRQVDLKERYYNPVVDEDWSVISGYHAQYWPHEPLWDQINDEQAAKLKALKVNLEHYSSSMVWNDVDVFTLRYGVDFDYVVMAIPIGALKCVMNPDDWATVNPTWKTMFDYNPTVTTQGFQLWFTPTTEEMGWTASPQPILGGYQHPYPDWGDMTLLLNPEEKAAGVQSLAHFAVVLPENSTNDKGCALTPDDHVKAAEEISTMAKQWLNNYIPPLWGNATDKPINPNGLKWEDVYTFGDDKARGDARFDSQYVSPNIDPSIRYDISPKNSTFYRIKPSESGFRNMMICGSWTDNGLCSSLMEGAVMSGMLAASALSKEVTGVASPKFEEIIGVIEYGDEEEFKARSTQELQVIRDTAELRAINLQAYEDLSEGADSESKED